MSFHAQLAQHIDRCIKQIQTIQVEELARATGFQKRSQRKVSLTQLVLGILALVGANSLTFERVAASISRCARQPYSKQALHKRLNQTVSSFLLALLGRCLQPALQEPLQRGLLATFGRVLLHDSSVIALPPGFAQDFPGSANQHKPLAQLKIQAVCDLLNCRVEHFSLSGFTRNDQSAAGDILALLRPGDLLIRDLGYFVLSVFTAIQERGAYFLSRYRHQTVILDAATGQPIQLAKHLKHHGQFDAEVRLGAKEKVPLRLVAVPVPAAVASRRRKLRHNRDKKLNPSKDHLELLGWNIFVTNIPADLWAAQQFPVLYRLRWRIETLFKTWKSHLALSQLSDRSLAMIHLSVMCKLLFCALVYRAAHHFETAAGDPHRHVSILRFAQVIAPFAVLIEAAFIGLAPLQLLDQLLDRHAFYDSRPDRKHFYDQLLTIKSGRLG